MAKYSDIKGFTVQTVSTDPAASAISSTTWASGGALPAAIFENAGAGATYNAALTFGGQGNPPSPLHPVSGETDSYNGTSWTEVAEMNTARRLLAGAGTQTAALAYAGWPPNYANTEEWNGSAWSEVNDLNTAGRQASGVGVNAEACLMVAGKNRTSNVESWNGTSWTEVAEVNTAREGTNNWGTSTSAVTAGGINAPGNTIANVESWDGSSWTEINDLNVGRRRAGTSGPDNTSGLFFGGDSPPPVKVASTEHFDGSAWTEVADLAEARAMEGSAGHSAGSSLAIGGDNTTPVRVTSTEQFIAPSVFSQITEGQLFFNSTTNTFKETIKDIPGATWASSGALNSPRGNAGTSGTQTAALFYGGDGPPGTIAITELYNGSSWTEVGDLNIARSQTFFSNQGTSTAALNATGSPIATNVESWNGSSWTETTDLNTGRRNGSSLGTQGAMLGTGGYASSYRTLTEIWDGSSWTETGDCPDAKFIGQGGGGTTTAGIIAGNYPNGDVDSSQTWDGTTWTNGPNINTGRSGIAFSATSQSSALAHGGGVGTPQAASKLTEFFDGTSWTELNDMAQVSQSGGGAGNSILGIHYGGYGPGALTTTEEWTAGLGNKTITAS